MRCKDAIRLTATSVFHHRARTQLTIFGIAIGIASVVLVTSIGEGINQYVMTQFTQFGSNIVEIQPGKTKTMGGSVGVFNTTRPLSIDDTLALARLPFVDDAAGFVIGNAEVEGNNRQRRTTIYGTDPTFPDLFTFVVATGEFLPRDNPHAPRATAVLGSKMRAELFGDENPLGQFVRIGGSRFRVVGVMQSKGQMLGIDLDDTVYIPVARAMDLFNDHSLMQIDLTYEQGSSEKEVVASIRNLLKARHGADDVTIATQEQVMGVLDSILGVMTAAVAGLGAISLAVGGIGIMTIMTIAVKERTREIGLLRAVGATRWQVLTLFLYESLLIAAVGGVLGTVLGIVIAQLLHLLIPALPVTISLFYISMAMAVALTVGLMAGVLPARLAVGLLPIDALRAE